MGYKVLCYQVQYTGDNWITATDVPYVTAVCGHTLEQVNETKYIGMDLSDKLNWTPHILYS